MSPFFCGPELAHGQHWPAWTSGTEERTHHAFNRGGGMRGHDGLQLLPMEGSAMTLVCHGEGLTNGRVTRIYILTRGALAWLYSFPGIAS